jgi:hypothetical protein
MKLPILVALSLAYTASCFPVLNDVSKRLLFESGHQAASADAFGGTTHTFQTNAPVVSGSGNSVTTGGAQSSQADATGGRVDQTLEQVEKFFGLSKRQPLLNEAVEMAQTVKDAFRFNSETHPGGASAGMGFKFPPEKRLLASGGGMDQMDPVGMLAKAFDMFEKPLQGIEPGFVKRLLAHAEEDARADADAGAGFECQANAPVVSGSGNSVTVAGGQMEHADAEGGSIAQEIKQSLGLRRRHHRSHARNGGN